LKTAAYAATGAWVGGIAQLIPWVGGLIAFAAAVYSVYLLYLGLPHTMKAPADRAAGYTAVTIIVAIILSWILWSIVGGIVGRGMWGSYGGPAVTVGDTGFEKSNAALEEWAKNMEKAGKEVEKSAEKNAGAPSAAALGALIGAAVGGQQGVAALPADQIKAFLPDTLAGLPRTSLSAERNAAMGFEAPIIRTAPAGASGSRSTTRAAPRACSGSRRGQTSRKSASGRAATKRRIVTAAG
jgi:hypothetical protein